MSQEIERSAEQLVNDLNTRRQHEFSIGTQGAQDALIAQFGMEVTGLTDVSVASTNVDTDVAEVLELTQAIQQRRASEERLNDTQKAT